MHPRAEFEEQPASPRGGVRPANTPAAGAAMWLASARRGFCEATTYAPEADCRADLLGAWQMPPAVAAKRALAAEWCLGRCARCSRCRFVSLSVDRRDCSWFSSCEELRTDVAGFVSGAAPMPSHQEEQHQQAGAPDGVFAARSKRAGWP
jgi:hypothetical protein